MDEWLNHPAVQAAVAPFVVALVVAWPLRSSRWLALAIAAGLAVTAALTVGVAFESLTATRKLVLADLTACLIAVVLEHRGVALTARIAWCCGALAAAFAIWMLWRVLQQRDAGSAVIAGVAGVAFAGAAVAGTVNVARAPLRGLAYAMTLAIGCGVLALLGASALLATLVIAAGAAAAAVLLALSVGGGVRGSGWATVLPVGCVSALAALAAVHTASLDWLALVPLVAAPWAAASLAPRGGRVAEIAIGGATALVFLLASFGLAWWQPGLTLTSH